ncbi:MAG: hypothetical protein K8U57_40455 [Planctomycetes bacterium]|nr:hypothetical protein [Planctomycetota bacterium]
MIDEPNIGLELASRALAPRGELTGVFVLAGGPPADTKSIEFSVLWRTSGKGTEDIGVVYYEAWKPDDGTLAAFPNPNTFAVALPPTPWSYDGKLIKIHWLARLRVRWESDGSTREVVKDVEFTLTPPART